MPTTPCPSCDGFGEVLIETGTIGDEAPTERFEECPDCAGIEDQEHSSEALDTRHQEEDQNGRGDRGKHVHRLGECDRRDAEDKVSHDTPAKACQRPQQQRPHDVEPATCREQTA